MNELGVGILGSGFMGRTYAQTVREYCPQARLAAVAGGSRAARLAADYQAACESSAEALVARRDVDVVFVTTPHHLHAAQALAAIEAGKHVMIEKPMAASLADCDSILAACRQRGVHCSVGFTQRSRKCNVAAKQLIDDGRIGSIRQILDWSFYPGAGLPAWQTDAANLGVLFGYGVHNLDRVRWLTAAEIATVYARCQPMGRQAAVEGSSMLLLELSTGAMATVWTAAGIPPPGFPQSQFSCRIVGELGLIDLDAYGELRLAVGGRWELIATQEPIDWQGKGALDPVRLESFAAHCHGFFDAILSGSPCPVSGRDGRQAVAAALAAYESARIGQPVRPN